MTFSLKNTPIRRKLMVILLATSGAAVLLTCAAFYTYELMTFGQTTREQLATLGRAIASNSTAALAFDNRDDATVVLTALKAEPHLVAGALYDRQGRLFARYPATLATAALPAELEEEGQRFDRAFLVSFQPVILDGKTVGTLFLKSDLDAIYARFRLYGIIVVLVLTSTLLVAYGLSGLLQRQVSGPILALASTARAVSRRGDYSVRAAQQGQDELGELTNAFNQMLAEIETLNRNLEQRVHQRTAELESANKELEAFSYSVSHDLRAPLRHIDGFAQLLKKQSAHALDPTGLRYLSTISNSAKRLGQLIDELLHFSRMGRAELRHTPVELPALIDEILRELQPDIPDRRIEWVVGELPTVEGDAAMLRQVWVNLLHNAVKYTRHRPDTRIEIKHEYNEANEHVFAVRDNGAGFDMRYASKLFGVFQRLHNTTEFEGTGVGLANVRRIILRHGGRTWAEGRVGEGATFYFTLPASRSPAEARPVT